MLGKGRLVKLINSLVFHAIAKELASVLGYFDKCPAKIIMFLRDNINLLSFQGSFSTRQPHSCYRCQGGFTGPQKTITKPS